MMDIWKPNPFHTNKTLFCQRDLRTVKGILVSLTPDGVLSFCSVSILQPLVKWSIELSNDISVISCNVLDILPVYVYTSTIFLSANLETSSSTASIVTTPAFWATLSRDKPQDGFLRFDVVALQHPSELLTA
jgi:hypothetical protein